MTPGGPPDGQVTICHWDEGANQYEQLVVPLPALAGHAQHPEDIWPPVEGWPEGKNWDVGQPWWEAGCEQPVVPAPSPSLPTTGVWDGAVFLLLFGLVFTVVGWLLVRGGRR